MPATGASAYEMLDLTSVRAVIDGLGAVRARIGGDPATWTVREVGDGNLNLVFLVDGPDGSVCVKQAVPYVRVAGPSWPMSLDRAFYEHAYYVAVASHVAGLIPEVLHYDPDLYCIIMERLSPHIILRHGLLEARRYPRIGRDLGEYVARASFYTSDLAQPFERKMERLQVFAGNTALTRISVDLIFGDPYRESPRNRHTSPELDATAAAFRHDGALKAAAARFGLKFLTEAQALLHGDLHSGSVMVTADDTRVIDPEFAFYGPIGFDLGAFFGNLLLSWYSQPGHATDDDNRRAYQAWILGEAGTFWTTFRRRFLALWADQPAGDAFPASMFDAGRDAVPLAAARNAFVDGLFADMLGFAACKMIRRILGFAHVMDFERIADPTLRGRCEAGALAMAHRLLTRPDDFRSLDDVLASVPEAAVR